MLAASIYDIFRDAPFGQLMRYLTSERIFQHPEEKADFKLPEVWLQVMTNTVATKEVTAETERVQDDLVASPVNGETGTAAEIERQRQHTQQTRQLEKLFADGTLPPDTESGDNLQHVMSSPIVPKTTNEGNILVDWYCTDDPANPHNWSNRRRIVLTSIICAYTFVVYTTSSIYTPSEEGVMKEFGVSDIKSSLGLAIYVLGYGVGPLIFSPLSEIPLIGRNPIYIVTMFLFVVLSIPTALVRNFPGLIILRFLQGFFGSPCLASGGASLGDMYSLMHLPFAMIAWVASAYCGRELLRSPKAHVAMNRPPANNLVCSRSRALAQWLCRARQGLAMVSIRVDLGIVTHTHYNVPVSSRDEWPQYPSAPCPAASQDYRRQPLHVAK